MWHPKYWHKVLVNGVDESLQAIIRSIVAERDAAVIKMKVMPDHVHLLAAVDPKCGIHRLARQVQGRSSRLLRVEASHLRSRLPHRPLDVVPIPGPRYSRPSTKIDPG